MFRKSFSTWSYMKIFSLLCWVRLLKSRNFFAQFKYRKKHLHLSHCESWEATERDFCRSWRLRVFVLSLCMLTTPYTPAWLTGKLQRIYFLQVKCSKLELKRKITTFTPWLWSISHSILYGGLRSGASHLLIVVGQLPCGCCLNLAMSDNGTFHITELTLTKAVILSFC